MPQVKCEFCGAYIDETAEKCPNCGAVNTNFKRIVSDTPRTIEELKEWYMARKLPPESVTRFFIGKNVEEPKAFGIYKDGSNFIVYKNKADGSRAIRYKGTDEDYAVNDYVDVVLVVFGEHDVAIVETRHGAVDAHADIAVAAQAVKDRPVLALASSYYRSKNGQARALFMRLYALDYAVNILAGDLPSADRAVRDTYPRIEQPQIVVYLRDGSDGRARVLGGRLLVD